MAQSYKTLKEAFVSNLSGGSIWEINHVTAVAPVCISAVTCLQMLNLGYTGSLSAMGRSTVTSSLLRRIPPCSNPDGLSSQCCSHPPSNNLVLALPIDTQRLTSTTSSRTLSPTSERISKKQRSKTTSRKEERGSLGGERET